MLERDKHRFYDEKKIDKKAMKRVAKKTAQQDKYAPLLKNLKTQMRQDPFTVEEDDRENMSSSENEEEAEEISDNEEAEEEQDEEEKSADHGFKSVEDTPKQGTKVDDDDFYQQVN